MRVWRGPDGIRVEVIVLDRRPRLRATQTLNGHRYLLGYYRDPQELTEHCDLADLVEVIDQVRSSGRAATMDINRRRQRPRPLA